VFSVLRFARVGLYSTNKVEVDIANKIAKYTETWE